MKKIFLIVLFISIFLLTGCSNITGKYTISEIRDKDTVVKNNTNYSIIVKSNKTAILKMEDEIKLKYNDKYFYSTTDNTDRIKYSFDSNKLILEIDDLKLVFKKK